MTTKKAKSKSIWSKSIPKVEGYYWVAYPDVCICPAKVTKSKNGVYSVRIMDGGFFTSTGESRNYFGFAKLKFGPKIELPE